MHQSLPTSVPVAGDSTQSNPLVNEASTSCSDCEASGNHERPCCCCKQKDVKNSWFVAITLLSLALVGAVPLLAVYLAHGEPAGVQMALNVLGLALMLAAGLAVMPSVRQEADTGNPFVCGLVASAALIPITVTETVAVGAYLAPVTLLRSHTEWYWMHRMPLAVGAVIGLSAWAGWAFCGGRTANPRSQNPRVFGELMEGHRAGVAALDAIKPEYGKDAHDPLLREAWKATRSHLQFVGCQLQAGCVCGRPRQSLRWVLQTGYMNVWRPVHRAEEALLVLQPRATILAAAEYDRLRLDASSIPNSKELIAQLERAVHDLERMSVSGAVHSVSEFVSQGPDPSKPTLNKVEARARGSLRAVRYAIDQFRDESWDSLIRQRNRLVEAVVLTRLTAFALLGVLIIRMVPVHPLLSATVFYLVGAAVGLFSRLRARPGARLQVEDYGLASAALIQTPMFSGLAALGGVAVTVLVGAPLFSATLHHPIVEKALTFAHIFNITTHPEYLVLAAVFGTAPELLSSRLQAIAEKYKSDISGTNVAQRSS